MKAIQVLLGHSTYRLTADTFTSVLPQLELEAADAALTIVPRKAVAQKAPGGEGQPQGPHAVPAPEADTDADASAQERTQAAQAQSGGDNHAQVRELRAGEADGAAA